MTTNDLVEVVRHYQRSIERHQEDESRLLHCVTKLYNLPIKVEHLQETGIGKTVNSLRKINGEVGVAAKTLVTKWKAMVAAEEAPVEQPTILPSTAVDQHGDDNHNDDDDNDDDEKTTRKRRRSNDSGEHDEYKHLNMEPRSVERSNSKERTHHSGSKSSTSEHKSRRSSSHHNSRHSSSDKHKREHKSHHNSDKSKHEDKQHHSSSSGGRGNEQHKEEKRHSDERKHKESTLSEPVTEPTTHIKSEGSSSSSSKHKPEEQRTEYRDKKHKSSKHKDRQRDSKENKHHKHKSSHKHDRKERELSPSTKKPATTPKPTHEETANNAAVATKRTSSNADDEISTPIAKMPKLKPAHSNHSSNDEEEKNRNADGFDSSMGANFADVLGMLSMPTMSNKKNKKSLSSSSAKKMNNGAHHQNASAAAAATTSTKKLESPEKPSTSSSLSSSNKMNGYKTTSNAVTPTRKPDLLSSTAKLEPLDPNIALELPLISTNYKPLPLNQTVMDVVFNSAGASCSGISSIPHTYKSSSSRAFDESEALAQGISSKTMRTKIYSGAKPGQIMQVLSLFDLCIRVLQKNIDALEYTGGVPFDVLRPVLERATPQQLLTFEDYNPYLMEDSDILWQQIVQRHYRTQRRQEMETWREMFLRCQEEKEHRLSVLAQSIKQSQKIHEAPLRKTQLAFVDSMVKPPRSVQRKQEQFGTRGKLTATPAARVAALSSVTPNAAKPGDTRLRVLAAARDTAQVAAAPMRTKKAPLMAKTLQLMRGRHKR